MSVASDMVDLYVAAEQAVLQGKTFVKGDRTWTSENLPEIRAGRREWERKLNAETARTRGIQSHSIASWE